MTVTEAPPSAPRRGGAPSAVVAPTSTPAVTPTRPGWARLTANVLLILTGLAAWLIAFIFGLSALQEHHSQSVLYSRFREQVALGVVPPFGAGTTLRPGDPVAVISAPAPGLHHVVVVEGATAGDLEAGPGHLPGTALPGESGVSTIMGRVVAYGAPFRAVTSLPVGATVDVTTGQGVFHYTVVDVRGPGTAIPATLATAASRLTLVTAATGGWHDLWVPSHAVFVDAVLQGKAVPVAAGTAPALADGLMSGDINALIPLVLWLQGLLLAAIGAALLRVRWGARQVWLVGAPVIAALLWGASTEFIRLLPNLF